MPWLSEALAGSGVALAVFRPIDRWWRWLQPGQLRRLHQKLCVVDGERAFVGGINIIDDRMDLHHGETEQPRLDFAVALCGPAVQPVAQAVRAVWTRAWLGRDFGEELLALVRSPEPVPERCGLFGRLGSLVEARGSCGHGVAPASLRGVRCPGVFRLDGRQRQ